MAKKSPSKKSSPKKRAVAASKKPAKRKAAEKPAKAAKPAKRKIAAKRLAGKKKVAAKPARAAVKKSKAPVKKAKAVAKRVAVKTKAALKKLVTKTALAKKKKPAAPKAKAKAKTMTKVAVKKPAAPKAALKKASAKPAAAKPAAAKPTSTKPAPASAPALVKTKAAAAPAHEFCWAELATTDVAAAKAFYTQLFPWEMSDMPLPEGSVYSMATLEGGTVGALFTMQAEMRAQGVPSHWNAYVSTPDVDATARRVIELGGTLLAEPFDVMDVGRMAVAEDPTGATFSLWQARAHKGFAHTDWRTGIVCWSELMTSDPAKAGAFYSKLFGWKQEPVEMTPGEKYTILATPDKQVAGMHQLPDDLKAHGVPSNWLMYWTVNNCDATVEKARSLGATVLFGPQSMPGIGRFAAIQDPQGAAFAVLQPE